MWNQKCHQFLGLAMSAGKVLSGEEIVLSGAKSKKVKLVLLATDVAKNNQKKVTNKCQTYGVPLLQVATTAEQSLAIGKANRVVIGITDNGFAKGFKERLTKVEEKDEN
ncbi:MAG: L7Ae/L30e/S12e/Gadd45 family ribosomal protein [Culicoidibacterales bacterium]